jgi:phosphotriesterase-related protein
MRAVARTHRATGAPITVHTHPGSQTGLIVKQVLCDEEGVDATRVVLGHTGDSADVDHLSALADLGFILGMDRFGLYVDTTFEARADTVVEMCRRGYADRMVLSHDTSCYLDMIDPRVVAMLTTWTYLHIHDKVLPYIRERGVTDAQIDTMLVDTPRRYFEHNSAY